VLDLQENQPEMAGNQMEIAVATEELTDQDGRAATVEQAKDSMEVEKVRGVIKERRQHVTNPPSNFSCHKFGHYRSDCSGIKFKSEECRGACNKTPPNQIKGNRLNRLMRNNLGVKANFSGLTSPSV
jgi:hypothetical protein